MGNISNFNKFKFSAVAVVLQFTTLLLPAQTPSNKQTREADLREIHTMIENIKCEREGVKALFDGPIDPQLWFERVDSGRDRILYLLKNGYDYSCKDMGGYDICEGKREYLNLQEVIDDKDGPTTYIPMIYICNMLESGNAFTAIDKKSNAAFSLWKSCTAWVNVDKELRPGGWDTNEDKLARAAEKNFSIIFKQVKTYNPNIIICGKTLRFFLHPRPGGYNILGNIIPSTNVGILKNSGNRKYYFNENVIIFDAYHPSYTSRGNPSAAQYCNDIVNAIREWKEKYGYDD